MLSQSMNVALFINTHDIFVQYIALNIISQLNFLCLVAHWSLDCQVGYMKTNYKIPCASKQKVYVFLLYHLIQIIGGLCFTLFMDLDFSHQVAPLSLF